MIFNKPQALLSIDLIQAAVTLSKTGSCVLPPGFAPPVPITLRRTVPELLKYDPLPTWGFSTEIDGQQHFAFRGTESLPEWIADFILFPLTPHIGFGFRLIYEAIRACVDGKVRRDAIIQGHSLGGSLACQLYTDMDAGGGQLRTFGCPRTGDGLFAAMLAGTERIVNRPDIVPKVPLPPFFDHGGTEVMVSGPGSILDPKLAHALTSYRAGILAL